MWKTSKQFKSEGEKTLKCVKSFMAAVFLLKFLITRDNNLPQGIKRTQEVHTCKL